MAEQNSLAVAYAIKKRNKARAGQVSVQSDDDAPNPERAKSIARAILDKKAPPEEPVSELDDLDLEDFEDPEEVIDPKAARKALIAKAMERANSRK